MHSVGAPKRAVFIGKRKLSLCSLQRTKEINEWSNQDCGDIQSEYKDNSVDMLVNYQITNGYPRVVIRKLGEANVNLDASKKSHFIPPSYHYQQQQDKVLRTETLSFKIPCCELCLGRHRVHPLAGSSLRLSPPSSYLLGHDLEQVCVSEQESQPCDHMWHWHLP